MLGFIWGAMPVALFAAAEPAVQLIIGCLVTGMMSGGAFEPTNIGDGF